jgi:hypothetical protein
MRNTSVLGVQDDNQEGTMAAVDVISLALRDGAKHGTNLAAHGPSAALEVPAARPWWGARRPGLEHRAHRRGGIAVLGAMWDEAHGGGDEARAVAAAVSDVGEVAEEQGGRSGAW